MLERFKPKPEDSERVSLDSLYEVVTAIFEKMGVPNSDAREAADVLTMTDLRGVETHGVSNMLRAYVEQYTDGVVIVVIEIGTSIGVVVIVVYGSP